MVKKTLCSAALLAVLMLLFAGLASAQGQFVYTNDDIGFAPNTVSGFSVASSGALTLVPGSPFLTGGMGAGGGLFASNRTRAGIVGNCLFLFLKPLDSLDKLLQLFSRDAGLGNICLHLPYSFWI